MGSKFSMALRGSQPYASSVLIVDDHPLVREGLTARISSQPDLTVCGEAGSVDEALELLKTEFVSLIIVDLALKNGHGLELIKAVQKSGAETRMLVVSAYEDSLFAERALRAGAHGYINKQEVQENVIEAIRTVLRGERYLSAEMTQRLLEQAVGGAQELRGVATLTDRELEIFELIGRGKRTSAIAQLLGLSIHTIESHREHIRAKLRLQNGTELLQRAVQWVLDPH
jgi:DNA-binding NarL/FixJ family response regulator